MILWARYKPISFKPRNIKAMRPPPFPFPFRFPLIVLAATTALTACTTVPLRVPPSWPDLGSLAARIIKIPPPASAPEPEPKPLPASAPSTVSTVEANPEVHYDTPGLAAERQTFTSHAEAAEWLHDLANTTALPTRAALLTLGTSQAGLPLHALVLTRAQGTDPNSLAQSKRPTVVLWGQQYGDEPAGAEALLVIAQQLARAEGVLAPLLDKINVVVMPRANPDAAQAGIRNTANGVDMNYDHLLLRTPEAQALAVLVRNYRPILVVDAHERNPLPSYDVLLQYASTAHIDELLLKAAHEWYHPPILSALQAQGLRGHWYHAPGIQATQPDTARNVNGLKNAVSLEIATRGVGLGRAHIQRRVHTQITAITSALHSTAERASALEKVQAFVASEIEAQACKNQMKTRARPCGYWLAQNAGTAVERLRLLGVQVLRVAESGTVTAESFQEATQTTQPTKQITLVRSTRDAPAGSYYVPLGQPLAHLAVAALELDTPSSYWSHQLIMGLADVARVLTAPALVFEELD